MSDEQLVSYTVKEVSELLALSTRTIHRYLESGDLTCHWMGRSIRISGEALDAYLTRHVVIATSTRAEVPRRAPVRRRQGA